MMHELLGTLSGLDVLVVGQLRRDIVELWTTEIEENLDVVITGKQRQHYLARHPEMVELESELQATVLDPDYVFANRVDHSMAIFYRRIGEKHCLRVAVLLQPVSGERKHSVLSYRLASMREVERNWGSCRWRRT
jgi:hypothetical protein